MSYCPIDRRSTAGSLFQAESVLRSLRSPGRRPEADAGFAKKPKGEEDDRRLVARGGRSRVALPFLEGLFRFLRSFLVPIPFLFHAVGFLSKSAVLAGPPNRFFLPLPAAFHRLGSPARPPGLLPGVFGKREPFRKEEQARFPGKRIGAKTLFFDALIFSAFIIIQYGGKIIG